VISNDPELNEKFTRVKVNINIQINMRYSNKSDTAARERMLENVVCKRQNFSRVGDKDFAFVL